MAFTHIDCFSGPGGICTGMHAAGFDTKVAIEYIKSCVDTYKANHPEVHVIHSDIRKVTAEQILPYIPTDGVDLVTSGMPCETFSTAGNTSRSFYDDRQFLFREGIRIAQIDPTLIVDVLKHELIAAGYKNMVQVVLDASQFGVPQRRKRFFILATKDKKIKLSVPEAISDKVVTVDEAFVDLLNVVSNSEKAKDKYGKKSSEYSELMRNDEFWKRQEHHTDKLTYQYPMRHRECTLERFSLLKQGESLKDLFEKYSGHVFEHYIVEQTRERLAQYNIRFVLQKELTTMLQNNQIANEDDDNIRQMAASDDFDIYAIVNVNGSNLVFGCVQAKTSIRDRVGRDRDFSIPAMERHFWSVAVVLDGTYLAMPKFNKMVNGGGETQYMENGWHGMYSMSNIETTDRIYKDEDLELLIEHASAASHKFTSARQRFDRYWRAVQND